MEAMSAAGAGAVAGVGASQRREGAAAGEEAIADALAAAGGAAQAFLLFSTVHHDPRAVLAGALRAAGDAPVIGGQGTGVLTGDQEIEDGPGVVAMAFARGVDLRATPLGVARDEQARAGFAAMITDGYSVHPEKAAASLQQILPAGSSIVGGLVVGKAGVRPAYRWHQAEVFAGGFCGLHVSGARAPLVGVAQGCKPIGAALTVTEARGNVIAELDGRPAFAAFAEVARPLLSDLPRAAQTLFLAIPDGNGDVEDAYVVRGILQFEPEAGLLAVSEPIAEGTRIRFALREAYAARENLRKMIERMAGELAGKPPRLGVYFNCAGRGKALFGVDDHDVSFIQGALGAFPLVGMFGGGELAPGRAAPRLQLFSGVLALIP